MENAAVFDFSLRAEQMAMLDSFNFGERAIGDESDLARVAEGDGVTLLAPWVKFDLVHCRRNLGVAEELLEMADHKVAHADCAAATFVEDALQRTPGVQTAVRHGPMEEEKVDLVQSESAVARIKGAQRLVIAVIAVPELRGDEYLFGFWKREQLDIELEPDIDEVSLADGPSRLTDRNIRRDIVNRVNHP